MRRARRFGLGASALLLALAIATAASGQSAQLAVAIRGADLKPNGATDLVVAVTGSGVTGTLTEENFTVFEAGQAITDLTVRPLAQTTVQPVTVALVMDMSVTAGQAIGDAKAAAKALVSGLPSNVRVALISFSTTPVVRVPFTTDKNKLVAAIDALQSGGRTAFFDALITATDQLKGVGGAQHNIVVLSDGEDNQSKHPIGDVVTAVKDLNSPITTVALQTTVLNADRLRALAA
ncbi:MAG: vWA domain-containing protein, partial [Actinomycetota bacterium]